MAPPTPMEPTPINPSNSTSTPQTATISVSTPTTPTEAPAASQVPSTVPNPDVLVAWDTTRHNYHNVRVLCDESGLSLTEKNLICACIFQESGFDNNAICQNKNAEGVVTSTDVGICQINSYFHCGVGKDFPSTAFVVANPQDAVQWMIEMYMNGLLKMWVSYSSGAYLQWLQVGSPMWSLGD